MPIYRGEGGSGESSTNALANEVAQDADDAANSASQAASSATAAANSATAAANSATAAAASETAAETAETNAETAETNAAASAAAAATSETNASTSETNAATSETNAATSASNASTSETNAATSETNAATSASNAATSETNAATSATNAAASETNAATSASQAATSATNAATSASDAATTYDNFDDRYLGEKTSDPSVDNDGDALITGALYFNSTAGEMRVWDGSAWEAAYLPASGYLHLSGGTMTGALTLHANPASNLQAATKQYVDDVAAEGIQYHTPVRVEQEGNLNATYNNGTAGVGATLTNAGTQAALVIDDITMVVNDRVLIYEQTDATQNGIYTVTDIGSASTNWVLTRATDADSYAPSDPDALAQGSGFFVQEGTLGAGEKYVCNTVGTITFGTTDITFVQVATAQIYTGGDGINVNGSTITNTGLLTTGSTATDLAITSADINGGNIDGTIIGATTPAAATFATLTSDGSTQYQWATDGSRYRLRTAGSTDNLLAITDYKYVGVGTPFSGVGALSTNFHVYDNNNNVRSRIQNNDGYFDLRKVYDDIYLDLWDSGDIIFTTTNATERMRINSSGRVGIGTDSPSTFLHVQVGPNTVGSFDPYTLLGLSSPQLTTFEINTDASSSGTIRFNDQNGLGGQITYSHALDTMSFWVGTSARMTIDSSGNVGIGTNSPSKTLELGTLDVQRWQTGSTTLDLTPTSGATDQFIFNTSLNAIYSFKSAGTERLKIDGAAGTSTFTGDVFTNADIVAGKDSGSIALTINDGYGNSNLAFNHQNGVPDQNGNSARIEVNTDQTSGAYMHFEGKSNVTGGTATSLNDMARMYADSGDFHANGNVIAYSTSISDERLKENVEQVTGALDMLDQIRGVTFDRKDTGKKSAGVIAQELEQVMPYAIYETALPLKTGSEDDVYKLVEYDALHAVLIEAIKELRAEVEELRGATN